MKPMLSALYFVLALMLPAWPEQSAPHPAGRSGGLTPAPGTTRRLAEPAARIPKQPEIAPGRIPPPVQPLDSTQPSQPTTQRPEPGKLAPAAGATAHQ